MERAESLYFTRIGVFKGEYKLLKLGKLISNSSLHQI